MKSFFVTLLLVGLGGSTAIWAMYRAGLSFLRSWWTLVPFWVLPLCFVFSNVYLNAVPRPLLRFLSWAGGLWMGFLYYSVLGMALFLVAFLVGKLGHWPFLAPRAAQVLFAGTVLLVAVGCWQALHPVVRKLEYATDKNIPGPYRIVFVSDLHFGGLFGTSYGETLVRRINEQNPDLILLGGDMVDGDLPFVLQEGSLGTFRKLRSTDGVYAVFGNHDKRLGSGAVERAFLEEEGVRFAVDENRMVNPWLNLTGMDDYLFGNRRADYHPEPGKFNVFMEHEPRRIPEAAGKGYDLYFAGHTHAGQMAPNRLITRKMYFLDYGSEMVEGMLATVSSGYGLWGVPVRTGPKPEIVVVDIKKAD